MENFFPYQITNLLTGPVRAVVAKRDDLVSLPTKPKQILSQVDPYTLVPPFFNFGAGINPGSFSRGNTQSDLTIEQDKAAVGTDVTDVNRTFQFNAAEFSPSGLAILEQSPGVEVIAAEAGSNAYDAVPFGTFDELDRYFVALIGRRRKEAGLAVEPSGKERGRMVIIAGYNCRITGDAQAMQLGKGALSGTDVTLQAYPDSSATAGEDLGTWWLERAGTHSPASS